MKLRKLLEPLPDVDVEQIHNASMKILKETGIVFRSREAVDLFKKHGAKVDGETVFIEEDMVEKALETSPAKFFWRARNDSRSVEVGNGFVVQPPVGPIFIKDAENGRRLSVRQDYINVIKLCQESDMIRLNGAMPVDPGDVPVDAKHLYMMYDILRHSDKPLIGFCYGIDKVRQNFDMLEMAMGGKKFLEENYCLGVLTNPLSPLGYAAETLEALMAFSARNQIVMIAPCIMAGVSGPINLIGTSILQNTEALAGVVLTQLVRPGAPVVYGVASCVGYMKTGSFAAGSPEAMLINMPNIQLAHDFYHLPTRTMCGITHAKDFNCQAFYETTMSLILGVLSGANIGVQCIGTLDALMTVSYEKIIIDQEIISRALRIQKGIDFSHIDQAVEIIQQVGPGGSYMVHPSTFTDCRSLWLPSVSDWESYDAWENAGSEDLLIRANRKYKEILANAPETLLDPSLQKDLERYIEKAV